MLQFDDQCITHNIYFIMGNPKSGKTLLAMTFPKPLLYISVGNDGGGRAIAIKYKKELQEKKIRILNLTNDPVQNGKIFTTSIEKLANVFAQLRKPEEEKFATIVIDTIGALQEDYKVKLETEKRGVPLSQPEWGEVGRMMLSIKDNMKRFSTQTTYNGEHTNIVWIDHTRQVEAYETSGLNKEIRICPTLTLSTGQKYIRDASNVFYCCRKTTVQKDGSRVVKFLTYIGPHPLMDTGVRDIVFLPQGGFIENFTYDKWQKCIETQSLNFENVAVPEENNDKENENSEVNE